MKSIQIRETPTGLYQAICESAKREGRSLSQQALAFLAKGAQIPLFPSQRRKDLLKEFKPFKISKDFKVLDELAEDRAR